MKKRMLGLLFTICILMVFVPNTYSENIKYGVFLFDCETGTIIGCDEESSGKLVIPSEINGIAVTAIGEYAFAYCGFTDIELPESVKSIGYKAFFRCGSLKTVKISNSVVYIDKEAFTNCYMLKNIDVDSKNLEYSSDNGVLFDKDQILLIQYPRGKEEEMYSIPSGVTDICDSAFEGAQNIIYITIPDSVTSIGSRAFAGCSSLKNIKIPNSVTSILPDAFDSCISLITVSLSNNMISINNDVFWGCSNLKSVEVPDSIISIGDRAFCLCSNLLDVYYTGSEEQWHSILIGTLNGDFTDSTVHYNAIGSKSPQIVRTPTVSGNNLNIDLNDVEYDSCLITVFSNDDMMVSLSEVSLSAGDTSKSVTIPNNTATLAKIFIWDSLGGMRPLCEAKTTDIE